MNAEGKIKVSLTNTDGTQQVYLNQTNDLALTLTNQSEESLPLTGGKPQNPPPAGGTFSIVLNLGVLFKDPTDQKKLKVSADGWETAYCDGQFPAWVLTPAQNLDWANNASFRFDITGLTPTVPLSSYYVSADLYNLDGLAPLPNQLMLGVANAPSGGKRLSEAMATSLNTATVYISRKSTEPYNGNDGNQLTLTFYNQSKDTALAPNKPWPAQPQFILSFIPDTAPPGYYALTTPDALNALAITVQRWGWKVVKQASNPVTWILEPTSDNYSILGTGADAIVQFKISGLFTQFAPCPTLMYIQYVNIPGYDDGIITLLLDKEYPEMRITKMGAGQTSFEVINDDPLKAYLYWQVDNSSLVELSGFGEVPSRADNFEVPVLSNMNYVLTAYDMMLGSVKSALTSFTVTPPISTRWTPLGTIAIWSGDMADLPAGWVVCDGANGVPDLRNFFVLGGGQTAPHQKDPLPTHQHALKGFTANPQTTMNGRHTHQMPSSWYARNYSCGKWTGVDTGGWFSTGMSFQEAPDHQHSLGTSFSLDTDPNTTALRPNWYALFYIIYKG